MPTWRRVLLKAAGFGAGVGVSVCVLLLLWTWWHNRPRPWNESTVTASYTALHSQVRGETLYLTFTYGFRNNGHSDYYVPDGVAAELLRRLPEGKGLQRIDKCSWPERIIIPPSQTVNIDFEVPIELADFNKRASEVESLDKLTVFLRSRLKEIDGFTFLDYSHHYQVELPNGWPKLKLD